ncbi:MAG: hypothetical protein ACRDTE_18850 [Pseudonocardiaceae bacterium]
MSEDSPDVASAKRLLDTLKARGFQFQRTAPGEDGPLLGNRVTEEWVDTIYFEGFSHDCVGWRQRRSSLIVPDRGLVERRVTGSALTVLNEVLNWKMES